MQRNRIHNVLALVFVIILSCNGMCGWTQKAWDQLISWDLLDSSKITTNFYGIFVKDVVTESSTTNYIPEVDSPLIGIDPFYDRYLQYGAFDTNNVIYTNSYFAVLHPLNYFLATNPVTTTNYWGTNFFYDAVPGEITTNYVSIHICRESFGAETNIAIDVDLLRDYEVLLAISERVSAVWGTNRVPNDFADSRSPLLYGFLVDLSKKTKSIPPFEFKNSRLNLVNFKKWIKTNIYHYIDITNSKSTVNSVYDFSDYLSTETNGLYNTSLPTYSITGLLRSVDAPTNYFNYTPYKTIFFSNDYGRVVTSSVEIIQYLADTNNDPDAIRTNVMWLYDGTTTNVTGTNDQIITLTSINTNISNISVGGHRDFFEHDYGYRGITNILSRMLVLKTTNAFWAGTNVFTVEHRHNDDLGNGSNVIGSYKAELEETAFSDASAWTNIASFEASTGIPFISWDAYVSTVDEGCQIAEYCSIEQLDGILNHTNDVGLQYELSVYGTMTYDVYTNEIPHVLAPLDMPKITITTNGGDVTTTTTYCVIADYQNLQWYTNEVTFTYSFDRGVRFVEEYSAGESNSFYVTMSNTAMTVGGDHQIVSYGHAFGVEVDTNTSYNISVEIDQSFNSGDEISLFDSGDGGSTADTRFRDKVYFNRLMIKNFAVTNGFIYY